MLKNVLVGALILVLGVGALLPTLVTNVGYICTNQALDTNLVSSLSACETWFQAAIKVQRFSLNERSRYGLANLYFLQGKLDAALLLVNELLVTKPEDDDVLLLRAEIYNQLGRSGLAIKDYEQIDSYPNASFLPHQVKNYLRFSDEQLASGNQDAAADALTKALAWDSNNWYALIHLEEIGRLTASIDSVRWDQPSVNVWNDPELLVYDLRALTKAYQLGRIQRETWFTTAHFIVWNNFQDEILLELQTACTNLFLNDSHCETLLDEACHRQGQLNNPVCLSHEPSPLVDLPVSDTNLLSNEGDFENVATSFNNHPQNWQWLPFFYRQRWGPGDFRGGTDCSVAYSGNCSLRIHGLWFERAEGVSWPKAGFATPTVDLSPGCYTLSFAYRTSPFVSTSHAGINLEQFSQGSEITLPDTNGRWEIYSVNFQTPQADSFSPMFRLWGMGTVWYDEVVLETAPC